MKKTLICIILAAFLVLLCSCAANTTVVKREVNAKVRYFDGSTEMIPLKSYSYLSGGTAILTTAYGDVMYIGTNNVIIIEEDEGQ